MNNQVSPKPHRPIPWATAFTVAACVLIFLGLLLKNDSTNPATLQLFGYVPSDEIWRGKIWGLVTSAFVHLELWHIAFNLYWLWTLGRLLERQIGPLAYAAFFVTSAFVSSTFQLVFSDSTGIGASGVVYSLFGFMLVTRGKYPEFTKALPERTIKLFIVWLIGCIFATAFKVLAVGNEAHVSGMAFGMLVAGALNLRYRPALTLSGLVALLAATITLLFWCPWSIVWLSTKAYDAHRAGRYTEALRFYARVLEHEPKSAWAYLNRSSAYASLGKQEAAQADLLKATTLDPDYVKQNTPSP